jgi:hypothetical protein
MHFILNPFLVSSYQQIHSLLIQDEMKYCDLQGNHNILHMKTSGLNCNSVTKGW